MNNADLILLNRWTETGDADAFKELVTRHAGMIYACCASRKLVPPEM